MRAGILQANAGWSAGEPRYRSLALTVLCALCAAAVALKLAAAGLALAVAAALWWGPVVILPVMVAAAVGAYAFGATAALTSAVSTGLATLTAWLLFVRIGRQRPWLPDGSAALQFLATVVGLPALLAAGITALPHPGHRLFIVWIAGVENALALTALAAPALLLLTDALHRLDAVWQPGAQRPRWAEGEGWIEVGGAAAAVVLAASMLDPQPAAVMGGALVIVAAVRHGVGVGALLGGLLYALLTVRGDTDPAARAVLLILLSTGLLVGRNAGDRMRKLERSADLQRADAQRRARLERALAGARHGIWELEPGSGTRWLNASSFELLGFDPERTRPSERWWLERVHPEDIERLEQALRDHLAGGSPAIAEEYRARHRDGRWIWIAERGRVTDWDLDGRPIRVTGTHTDITRRKRAEQRERTYERQLRHAQKLQGLDVMAGKVAHDFRNLLTSIMGHADLAAINTPAGQPIDENLTHIGSAVEQAAALAQQLLDFARPQPAQLSTVDLSALTHQMTTLASVSVHRDATLDCALDPALPPVQVDAQVLRELLLNLITNASEALEGEPGTIEITTGVRVADGEGDGWCPAPPSPGTYVFLRVRDTGCGMDERTRKRVFDPFFTTKPEGSGLGLALALDAVRAHQGSLHLESAPGQGTSFTLMFPALVS